MAAFADAAAAAGKNAANITNLFGECKFGDPVTHGNHPAWYPPTEGHDSGLRVHNSLLGDKYGSVPFVPVGAGGKRRVLWYTCGPTVYDSCHMGHARAYLTFAILRRIMEDYFGYEVLYQINITDIDDKIILRARRNKLLADYAGAAGLTLATVQRDVEAALERAGAKLRAKLAKLQEPLPEGTPSRDVEERKTVVKAQGLKLRQYVLVCVRVAEVVTLAGAKDAQAEAAARLAALADEAASTLG